MNNFLLLKEIFFKHIVVIILVGFVGAFLAGAEKYSTKDVQIQSGMVVLVNEVQFAAPDETSAAYPFQYGDFIKSMGNICKFINKLDKANQVDMEAINSDWKKLSLEKKYAWIDKYVQVRFFGKGRCQIFMYMDANTPKDVEACSEQGKNFLELYMESTVERLRVGKPGIQMTIISTEEYKPETTTTSQKNLVYKYAAIGFVLGMMLSVIALFIAASRKK